MEVEMAMDRDGGLYQMSGFSGKAMEMLEMLEMMRWAERMKLTKLVCPPTSSVAVLNPWRTPHRPGHGNKRVDLLHFKAFMQPLCFVVHALLTAVATTFA